MIENIRLSFQGIWSHKMRSFLTMLGIIIGIAAIISIVSTIKGTNEQIKNNLIGAGTNTVQIQLYSGDYEYEILYNGLPDGIPVIDDRKLQDILDVPNVISASLFTIRTDYDSSVYYGNKGLSSSRIYGTDNSYFPTNGMRLKKGRLFTETDFTRYRPVILIDSGAEESLFEGEDPLGKTVEIGQQAFTVIGVVEEDSSFEPVINSWEEYYTYYGSRTSARIFVNRAVWPMLYTFDEPQNVCIRVANTESMTSAGAAVEDILNADIRTDSPVRYKAQDLLQQAEELQNLSNATNSQLIWIASISLLVGGIGVMNIMLVSVTERTREIGLKKAIGAPKRKILWQFLTEAAVLTSIGGLVGVGAGIALAEIISRMTSAPVAVDIGATILAVAFSMVIGIVFGLLPSFKAANLNPIDALRHE